MINGEAPTVEMLWEPYDALEVLRRRFGHENAEAAGRWVSSLVADHWDVDVVSCDRLVLSDRNALAWLTTPDGGLVAKWSVAPPRFGRLAETARLTRWLDVRGLPVSAPVPASDGRLQVEAGGASLGVQRVVEADLLDVADPAQVHAAGVVLARLHLALADYPETDRLVPQHRRPPPLVDRVEAWLDQDGGQVAEPGRTLLRALLADARADLPAAPHLLHGDFRSGNVLCAGSDVAAVLDLEEVRVDHAVDEVARSAVMLGTRFVDWGPVSGDVRAAFLTGYRSVRPLTDAEEAWWDALVLWHALRMVPEGDDPTGWRASAEEMVTALRSRR